MKIEEVGSTLYKPLPMSKDFIEAESMYYFLFPEKKPGGRKIRTRPKGADFFLEEEEE